MRIKECIMKVLVEILYLMVMVIYLFNLNILNKKLLSTNFSSSFNLLIYNDYAPLKFFGVAIVLFILGCILVNRGLRRIRRELDSFEEMIVSCLATIIIIILLFLLIAFIDNPILKAVFTVCLLILGGISIGK